MRAQVGEFWTLENTFVMEIIAVRNGVASLATVDLRNGSAGMNNRIITDFGRLKVLRRATTEEIARYNEIRRH